MMKLFPLEMTIVELLDGQSPTKVAEGVAGLMLADEVVEKVEEEPIDEEPDDEEPDNAEPVDEELTMDVEVVPILEPDMVATDPDTASFAPQMPPLLTAAPTDDFR